MFSAIPEPSVGKHGIHILYLAEKPTSGQVGVVLMCLRSPPVGRELGWVVLMSTSGLVVVLITVI